MPKKILITEKPSVAMEFAKVLDIKGTRKDGYIEAEEWIITWCVGHLVTMSYPEKYDENLKFWRLDTLPFMPKEYKYEVIPSVEKQFKTVKNLLQREDVTQIYVATDSGREGEYIYRLVEQMAEVKNKERKRVWIDSQTEDEIQRGIKEAKCLDEYNSLSDSAYLRAKEDYLIGINFSRLLSIIFSKKIAQIINEDRVSVSVGRVMTCVLGMIVSREREIKNFNKTPYYKIIGEFGENSDSFKAEWKVNEKSRFFDSEKLYNESGFKKIEDAKNLIENLYNKKAVVLEIKKSKQKENAPLLYNLAELQNECAKKFKIKPDETLEKLQSLYEKKLITYPRTDARVLSSAVAKILSKNLNGIAKFYNDEEIKEYIRKMIENKYSTDILKTKYVNDSKITDHYAIIPTGQGFENYDKLSNLEKQIYKLIVKRFISIFYPPAEFNKISVIIDVDNEFFHANGKICIEQGYLEVVKPKKELENSENHLNEKTEENINRSLEKNDTEKQDESKKDESIEQEGLEKENIEVLNSLKKGKEVSVKKYLTKDTETTPPSRYNSGSIILAMENAGKLIEDEELREQIKGAGIGTSATRAEIMKKLERINYISINEKTQIITPTQKGDIIFDVVRSSIPDMLDPKLTASWEKGLEMVAKKEIDSDAFMLKLESYIDRNVKKAIGRRN